MKNAKAQLREFYEKQGLTGKHRRKAMQYDMKAVRANANVWTLPGRFSLSHLFLWDQTPQGWLYWHVRDRNE